MDNWSRNIHVFFDKPDRFKALYHVREKMPKSELCKIFGEVWINSESHYKNLDIIKQFLDYFDNDYEFIRNQIMDDAEKKQFEKFAKSKTIRIYRGCYAENIEAYSWTINKKTAEWFAKRYVPDGQPLLVSALAKVSDIIIYLKSRDENEIVIDHNKLVDFTYKRLPKLHPSTASMLYQAIQAGNFFNAEHEKQKYLMLARLNKEKAMQEIKIRLNFYYDHGFIEEHNFWMDIKKEIK